MATTHNGETVVSLDQQTFDPVDIDSLPLPSSLNLPSSGLDNGGDINIMGLLPELPPVDISEDTPGNLDQIISALPPPIPIDTYSLEYGPTSSTEPQLEPPHLTEDGEIPRFDEVNDQYEFLRKTLSHSRRRYSARFKRPRPTPQRQEDGESDEQSSLDFPGKRRTTNIESNLDNHTSMVHSPSHRIHQQHQHTKHHSLTGTHHHKHRKHGVDQYRNSSPAVNRRESRVDNQGRTYYLDHDTRTVNYDDETNERPNTQGIDPRREMLNRRYQSLQRSFRSAHHQRRDPSVPTTLTPIESVGAISYMPLERESPQPSSTTGPRSKKGKSKSAKWFTFGRKSHTSTIPQSPATSEISDDVLPISTQGQSPDIFSPLSPPPSLEELGISLDTSEGLREHHADSTITEREINVPADSSLIFGPPEVERGGNAALIAIVNSEEPHIPHNVEEGTRTSVVVTDLDRAAAVVAHQRMHARRSSREGSRQEEGDTDDETNVVVSPRSSVLSSPTEEQQSDGRVPREGEVQQETEEQNRKESVTSNESKETGTKIVGQLKLSEGLKQSPALKFITRHDLYTFLNSVGEAGEEFFSQRALMELVQRIRADNKLFVKYQHSRQLIKALNKFAREDKDLPEGWEKKLNRQGRVFFIDHTHKMTTFIDPRLPKENDEPIKSPPSTISIPAPVRRVYSTSDEPDVRPHHSTVVHSQSVPGSSGNTAPARDSNQAPPSSNEPTYEDQVVAFFQQSNVIDIINGRYRRGVRPQMREVIQDIRQNGVSALERVQLSGSGLALELTLILSMFEEEISTLRPQPPTTTPQIVVDTAPTNGQKSTGQSSTIQRQKQAFAAKLQTFKLQLARLGFAQSSRLKFNIRRDHLLEDAYEHTMKSEIRQLQRKRLNIAFRGEEGLDYGGPSREFFFLLSRFIFNPYYGLFEYSANDTYTIQISPTSSFIQNNLDWFRFAGRIVGLVIAQGFLLDVFFTRPVYKSIIGKPPSLRDLESLEPAFYNSLLWIQENDPEPLDLTFTIEEEAFGQLTTHELKEGGSDIPVLEENKQEYIELMIRWRLDRGVHEQTQAFLKGFAEIMPRSLLQPFDSHEVEFLIAGTLEIDVDDWRNNTDYRNGYHADHPVIVSFWKAVEMFDNEQRLRLLQFVTGTSSVPYEGFKALRGSSGPKRFTIDFFNEVRSLPRAHTCFNRLDLPPYPTFEILYEKLQTAIEEGGTFGIE